MIDIYFGKKTDGTPILSKSNIEVDVENILLDYNNGNVLNEPQPTPLDELTEFYYGLNMDFKSFQNVDILGVSVFTNGNINILENNIPKTTMVKKNTIILSEDITCLSLKVLSCHGPCMFRSMFLQSLPIVFCPHFWRQ